MSYMEPIKELYYTSYPSVVGMLYLVSDEEHLLYVIKKRIWENYPYLSCQEKSTPVLQKTKLWLDRYFSLEKPCIEELPILFLGTSFQRLVWSLLCQIPYGTVTTYGAIAKEVARIEKKKAMSAQAVGSAIGKNPICIIVPCHRVIGKDGNLTGFGGGIDMKIKLLQIENIDTTKFYMPKEKAKT